MPTRLISWIAFCAVGLALPAVLILFAWRRHAANGILMLIPFLAILVLALSMDHDIRWMLIGADYTHRLYITIAVFIVITFINAIIDTIRRAWSIAIASAVLSLAWLFVGVVNSVA